MTMTALQRAQALHMQLTALSVGATLNSANTLVAHSDYLRMQLPAHALSFIALCGDTWLALANGVHYSSAYAQRTLLLACEPSADDTAHERTYLCNGGAYDADCMHVLRERMARMFKHAARVNWLR